MCFSFPDDRDEERFGKTGVDEVVKQSSMTKYLGMRREELIRLNVWPKCTYAGPLMGVHEQQIISDDHLLHSKDVFPPVLRIKNQTSGIPTHFMQKTTACVIISWTLPKPLFHMKLHLANIITLRAGETGHLKMINLILGWRPKTPKTKKKSLFTRWIVGWSCNLQWVFGCIIFKLA